MKEKNGEHPFGDAGQLIALAVFLIIWAGDSYFLHQSTFLAKYVPLFVRLIILGLALVTGGWLAKVGHIVLSHDRRPEGVMTTGAFRYVRHPLYSASLLTYLGLTVSTLSLYSLAVFMVIFLFHNYIAGFEEALLEAKFGEEYATYKKRTGRWIPRVGGRH